MARQDLSRSFLFSTSSVIWNANFSFRGVEEGRAMSIFKRGKIYWFHFIFNGEHIQESTKQGNPRTARQIEAAHRTALAKGEVGIIEREQAPSLSVFIEKEFLPFVSAHFKATPKTAQYYEYGARLLRESDLWDLKLDHITSQHGGGFIARNSELSPSTINCGLRTLRRALNLAEEWGKLTRSPKIALARGERQRERVLTDAEFLAYRDLCRQPWSDLATLLYGTGIRPGEAYRLRWECVSLKEDGSRIQIVEGKSKAARRLLPLIPEVCRVLQARWESQGCPTEGWVFPSASESGHLEEGSAKIQHGDAVKKLQAVKDAFDTWKKSGSIGNWQDFVGTNTGLPTDYILCHAKVLRSGVRPFEPYCLRHTSLTRLAEAGCDAFTLARIAGHSSITITQRYCHPQAEAIEAAFGRLAAAGIEKRMPPATFPATGTNDQDSELPEVIEKMVSAVGIEPTTY
jgi:integrase